MDIGPLKDDPKGWERPKPSVGYYGDDGIPWWVWWALFSILTAVSVMIVILGAK